MLHDDPPARPTQRHRQERQAGGQRNREGDGGGKGEEVATSYFKRLGTHVPGLLSMNGQHSAAYHVSLPEELHDHRHSQPGRLMLEDRQNTRRKKQCWGD
jgi:hypothetical protein